MINNYKNKREKIKQELLNLMKLGYKILYIDENKNLFLYKEGINHDGR